MFQTKDLNNRLISSISIIKKLSKSRLNYYSFMKKIIQVSQYKITRKYVKLSFFKNLFFYLLSNNSSSNESFKKGEFSHWVINDYVI